MRQVVFACVMSIVAKGCSHIPDPGAIPKVEPYDILHNIRCEVGWVVSRDYPNDAVRYANIAYGLTLKAEENNNTTAALTMVWPIHLGSFTLGASGGKERFRSGETIVNIVEGVDDALKTVEGKTADQLPCLQEESPRTHAYPILGSVGMRDVIRRFVEVNRLGATEKFKEQGFSQTLKFHLKFLGGVKPSFAIKYLDGREASGNVELKADRKDLHELIIKIEPGKAPVVKIDPGGVRRRLPPPAGAEQPNRQRLRRALEDQQNSERYHDRLRDALRDALR